MSSTYVLSYKSEPVEVKPMETKPGDIGPEGIKPIGVEPICMEHVDIVYNEGKPVEPTPVRFELLETEPVKIELNEHAEVEPTPKPVKFDFNAVDASKDPNIACPVPLRLSPDSPLLQSSDDDSPQTIGRQPPKVIDFFSPISV